MRLFFWERQISLPLQGVEGIIPHGDRSAEIHKTLATLIHSVLGPIYFIWSIVAWYKRLHGLQASCSLHLTRMPVSGWDLESHLFFSPDFVFMKFKSTPGSGECRNQQLPAWELCGISHGPISTGAKGFPRHTLAPGSSHLCWCSAAHASDFLHAAAKSHSSQISPWCQHLKGWCWRHSGREVLIFEHCPKIVAAWWHLLLPHGRRSSAQR